MGSPSRTAAGNSSAASFRAASKRSRCSRLLAEDLGLAGTGEDLDVVEAVQESVLQRVDVVGRGCAVLDLPHDGAAV